MTVFPPDPAKAPELEQKRWSSFIVQDELLSESDKRFTMWLDRNIQGSWGVTNGPRKRWSAVIEKINACCHSLTGIPLYSRVPDSSVAFPGSRNTHAYEDSHKSLYGFLGRWPAEKILDLFGRKTRKGYS